MRWINIIIFNAVAPLPELHQISDAGAGKNSMQLTPTRDTELIACGRANTSLNGLYSPSPVVSSQSVTPAILVHGVLRALQHQGYKIRLHCYQLGLVQQPDFSGSLLDDVVCHHCLAAEEGELIRTQLLPELERQANNNEAHVIAECGVGGTTFATLWLRHWLDRTMSLAGSTNDPEKLAVKEQILTQLMESTAAFPREVQSFIDSDYGSDPVQRALHALLTSPLPTTLNINLAGGMMFAVPLLAITPDKIKHQLRIATTRWVLEGRNAQTVLANLPRQYDVYSSVTDFNQSAYRALHLYEQGFVVEGCGLGGCLVMAEQLGLSQSQIMSGLDAAVKPWLE
ncbi:hypothetical protein [Photobacterium nomapromontoriensis]|uniref:hypothetical protein n=1 Tax=Photobacterium nomapromontoriensis TaxID=2910237 RepID=UPI003D0E9A33